MAKDQHASDDRVLLAWIVAHVKGLGSVVDLAGPDSPLLRTVKTKTGATSNGPGLIDVALCCDLLSSLSPTQGRVLIKKVQATTLIVTVPNRHSRTYRVSKRQRPSPLRSFSAASLADWLDTCGWQVVHRVEPIVGTLADSIWLGAVCHRRVK